MYQTRLCWQNKRFNHFAKTLVRNKVILQASIVRKCCFWSVWLKQLSVVSKIFLSILKPWNIFPKKFQMSNMISNRWIWLLHLTALHRELEYYTGFPLGQGSQRKSGNLLEAQEDWCYYLHLVLRWFNIVNPFYCNLSEVVFHLVQEKKLYAINCVVFFAEAFISSLNTE